MAFKIQDLMTDVLPESVRWATCPGTSCGGYAFAAASNTGKGGQNPPECPPVSRGGGAPKPNPKPRPPADYADLALLQSQLHQALNVQA
jgi:hypothetical protein